MKADLLTPALSLAVVPSRYRGMQRQRVRPQTFLLLGMYCDCASAASSLIGCIILVVDPMTTEISAVFSLTSVELGPTTHSEVRKSVVTPIHSLNLGRPA